MTSLSQLTTVIKTCPGSFTLAGPSGPTKPGLWNLEPAGVTTTIVRTWTTDSPGPQTHLDHRLTWTTGVQTHLDHRLTWTTGLAYS